VCDKVYKVRPPSSSTAGSNTAFDNDNPDTRSRSGSGPGSSGRGSSASSGSISGIGGYHFGDLSKKIVGSAASLVGTGEPTISTAINRYQRLEIDLNGYHCVCAL
jgi:hypothetical protein